MLTVEVLLVLAEMNAKTSKLAKNIHSVYDTKRLLHVFKILRGTCAHCVSGLFANTVFMDRVALANSITCRAVSLPHWDLVYNLLHQYSHFAACFEVFALLR